MRKEEAGFNPLHCGAVVASGLRFPIPGHAEVSIPFIAGQWSLQLRKEEARDGAR